MKKFWRSLAFALLLPGHLAWAMWDVTPQQFGVAVEAGDTWRVRGWLDEGLPPDFMADRLGSGVMIAAWEGNIPMMELFVSRGARLDITNKNGEQALQLAAFKGHIEAVKWLLARGAPINRNGKAWAALHYAVFNGHQEIADLLIQQGADVNARVPNDATPLMLAAREGHSNIAEQLVKAGADPRLTNDMGESAANWAVLHGHLGIAKMVSSPETFASLVANNQPVQPPQRSISAPTQIDDLLRRIRYAEAQNLPTAGLRKALMTAVERARLEAKRAQKEAEQRNAKAVKGVVITARRPGGAEAKGGERVDLVTERNVPAAASRAAANPAAPVNTATAGADSARIQLLLAKIRAAKANGQPTDDLRKELFEAISGYGN